MGLRCGFFLWIFGTKLSLSMKASLAFERYAVSAQTLEAVLVLSSKPSRSLEPSLAAASVVFHFRISRNFRSMEMCDL
jgi:hypothetical protein